MADRTVRVRLSASVDDYTRSVRRASMETGRLHEQAEEFERRYRAHMSLDASDAIRDANRVKQDLRDIDGKHARARISINGGRGAQRDVQMWASLIASLGPAAVTASAVATPALFSIANAAGVAGAGLGTLGLSLYGVGDALKAMNDVRLDPTEARIEKLDQAMQSLSAEGQRFVEFLYSMRPALRQLRDAAQAGFLPGLEEGIEQATGAFPQLLSLVENTSSALGELAVRGGDALNDPFWQNYIEFIAAEAKPQMEAWGSILGNLAEGFAAMQMAFDPLADSMTGGLERMTRRFADWSHTLSTSNGFAEFSDYVRENGPVVANTLGSLGEALGALAVAAAPVGPVVLDMVRALAELIEMVAEIPLIGTALISAAVAIGVMNRAVRLFEIVAASRIVQFVRSMGSSSDKSARGMSRMSKALGVAGAALAAMALFMPDFEDDNRRMAESVGVAGREMGGLVGGLREVNVALAENREAMGGTADYFEGVYDRFRGLVGGGVGSVVGFFGAPESISQTQQSYDALMNTFSGLVDEADTFISTNRVLIDTFPEASALLNKYNTDVARFGEGSMETLPTLSALIEKVEEIKDVQYAAGDAVDAHTFAVIRQRQEFLGLIDTDLALRESKLRVNEALEENGVAWGQLTEAAVTNEQAIRRQAQTALEDLQNKIKTKEFTEAELVPMINAERDALWQAVFAMSGSREEADRYIAKMGLTVEALLGTETQTFETKREFGLLRDVMASLPPAVNIPVTTPGMQEAIDKTGQLGRVMANLSGVTNVQVGVSGQAGNPLTDPLRRASGGKIFGPGSSTSDSIPLMASVDEWVINARASREQGDDRMALLNAGQAEIVPRGAMMLPGGGWVAGDPPGYATGGKVVDHPVVINARPLAADLDRAIEYWKSGPMRALNFAYSQEGKPYVWGGVGPGGYDCSGFMSALVNVMRGRNPYSRVGSTGTFPWSGFQAGWGPGLNIGSFRGNPGHMAGTLAGHNVESGGGVGVRVDGPVGAGSSMFGGNVWHLPFDRGGELVGRGAFHKDTLAPERVLDPAQTRAFNHLVQVISDPRFLPRMAQAAGVSGGGVAGAVTVRFSGNVDGAFATAFQRLVKTGQIKIDTN